MKAIIIYLSIFPTLHLIVSRDILMQGPKQYHRDHSTQEQYNNQRIEYREPLYIRLRHRFKDIIPSWRPFDGVVLDKGDSVRVGHAEGFVGLQVPGYFEGGAAACVTV